MSSSAVETFDWDKAVPRVPGSDYGVAAFPIKVRTHLPIELKKVEHRNSTESHWFVNGRPESRWPSDTKATVCQLWGSAPKMLGVGGPYAIEFSMVHPGSVTLSLQKNDEGVEAIFCTRADKAAITWNNIRNALGSVEGGRYVTLVE